jgi:Asp/Glu/hydantoin racemase
MSSNPDPDAFIGVLMLDTQFPRVMGDIGNPATFAALNLPARYRVVANAFPRIAVSDQIELLFEAFLTQARVLQEQGARLITTSCGFLVQFQARLEQALKVPIITSSLVNAPKTGAGILTINTAILSTSYLAAAALPLDTPVVGVAPGCEFQSSILENKPQMNMEKAKADVLHAAAELVNRYPAVSTIVLECTNMVPYAKAIEQTCGRPVQHLVSHLEVAWRLIGSEREALR